MKNKVSRIRCAALAVAIAFASSAGQAPPASAAEEAESPGIAGNETAGDGQGGESAGKESPMAGQEETLAEEADALGDGESGDGSGEESGGEGEGTGGEEGQSEGEEPAQAEKIDLSKAAVAVPDAVPVFRSLNLSDMMVTLPGAGAAVSAKAMNDDEASPVTAAFKGVPPISAGTHSATLVLTAREASADLVEGSPAEISFEYPVGSTSEAELDLAGAEASVGHVIGLGEKLRLSDVDVKLPGAEASVTAAQLNEDESALVTAAFNHEPASAGGTHRTFLVLAAKESAGSRVAGSPRAIEVEYTVAVDLSKASAAAASGVTAASGFGLKDVLVTLPGAEAAAAADAMNNDGSCPVAARFEVSPNEDAGEHSATLTLYAKEGVSHMVASSPRAIKISYTVDPLDLSKVSAEAGGTYEHGKAPGLGDITLAIPGIDGKVTAEALNADASALFTAAFSGEPSAEAGEREAEIILEAKEGTGSNVTGSPALAKVSYSVEAEKKDLSKAVVKAAGEVKPGGKLGLSDVLVTLPGAESAVTAAALNADEGSLATAAFKAEPDQTAGTHEAALVLTAREGRESEVKEPSAEAAFSYTVAAPIDLSKATAKVPSALTYPSKLALSGVQVTLPGAAARTAAAINADSSSPVSIAFASTPNANAGSRKATLVLSAKAGRSAEVTGAPAKIQAAYTVKPASKSVTAVALSKTSYTYDGKTHKPTVKSITAGGKKMTSGFTTSYSGKEWKKAGTYTVTVSLTGNYTGKKSATYKITKAKQAVKLPDTKGNVKAGKSATVKVTGVKSSATVKSSNAKVVKVTKSSKGSFTYKGLKAGTAKVTVTAKSNANYAAASTKMTIVVSNKNAKSQKLTIKPKSVSLAKKGKTNVLKVTGAKTKVTYASSNKAVAKVSSKGKITAVKKGTCYVTVEAAATKAYTRAVKKIKVTVKK